MKTTKLPIQAAPVVRDPSTAGMSEKGVEAAGFLDLLGKAAKGALAGVMGG